MPKLDITTALVLLGGFASFAWISQTPGDHAATYLAISTFAAGFLKIVYDAQKATEDRQLTKDQVNTIAEQLTLVDGKVMRGNEQTDGKLTALIEETRERARAEGRIEGMAQGVAEQEVRSKEAAAAIAIATSQAAPTPPVSESRVLP